MHTPTSLPHPHTGFSTATQCHEREQDLKKRLSQANTDANKAMASASAAALSLEQKQSILTLNQRCLC